MRTPSQIEAIFSAALDRKTGAERACYLDQACDGDEKLRRRVEELLEVHPLATNFLARPAVKRPAITAMDPNYQTRTLDSAETSEGDDDQGEVFEFLSPPGRPDSLGRIGHYEILQILGRGAFGIVFRAFDDVLQRVVAVKVLSPRLAVSSPARKRFLREARSAAMIRHENVVHVYAVEEQPLPFLVMEFIPGETLQQRLDTTGPLDVTEAAEIGRQIAEGLAAAHATGLIHRDIKPGNILIEPGPQPRVRITDFGLARAADDASLTQSGTIAGTPMFMSPEQAHGEKLDHRADLFSLGSVLYTMCSGRPPFRASTTLAVLKRVAEETPRPIPEIIPEVPQWLVEIITRLHAKKPEDRIASAREVADLLAHGLALTQCIVTAGSLPKPATAVELKQPSSEFPAEPVATLKSATAFGSRLLLHRSAVATIAILLVLGGVSLTEATGVTNFRGTVIRLFSPTGTLVVEVDAPGISIQIDESDLVITGAGVREIRLTPGSHTVEARRNGQLISRELVSVTENGRQIVRVSQEAVLSGQSAVPLVDADAWERSVAELPTKQQIEAVSDRLKKLNPGFDGALSPTITNDAVTGLDIMGSHVTDISPLRAFTHLQVLGINGQSTGSGSFADLSPLTGMNLSGIYVYHTQVEDLTPLKGMQLEMLNVASTRVSDLSALRGMKVTRLYVNDTQVKDLSPLRDSMVEVLDISRTPVSDLSPLMGTELHWLKCQNMPTECDLTPLKDLPLGMLWCDFRTERDVESRAVQQYTAHNQRQAGSGVLEGS